MSVTGDAMAVTEAGSLRLALEYVGEQADLLGGERSQFRYEVRSGTRVFVGNDLYAGVNAAVTARQMLGTFAAFLADAGDRYRTDMCPPDDEYPEWMYEEAYSNSDELAMLAVELEDPGSVEPADADGHWYSIVFFQGEDADRVIDLIELEGPEAGIEYLAQWDLGDETVAAAEANGHVYDAPPSDRWSREYRNSEYHLSWTPTLGHVGLSRLVPATPGSPRDLNRGAAVAGRRQQLGPATPTTAAGVGQPEREPVHGAVHRM